uniref:cartilage intermediate layer protein 1-like n=1 Tax=Styela clava TaxID=7725 RepID=UPI00193A3919|nr:cartilage intermediate layer protein 1-like [Styela clava]
MFITRLFFFVGIIHGLSQAKKAPDGICVTKLLKGKLVSVGDCQKNDGSDIVNVIKQDLIKKTLEPTCKGKWTEWFNRDHPSGSGDYEDLQQIIIESKGGTLYYICSNPTVVHARALNPERPWQYANENVHISTQIGIYCKNREQTDGYCEDYKVRFCCE